jgi:divalent metal cation (Fe/Co/Zn/Cd) transporter
VENREAQLRRAIALSAISVVWSGLSGTVAVRLAITSGSLSLLGFGVDAVLDSIASIALIWRFSTEAREPHRADRVEHLAEAAVGVVLLAVSIYLVAGAARSLLAHDQPERSDQVIVLLLLSLAILPSLALEKRRVASRLGSGALRADSLLTALAALLAAIGLSSAMLTAALDTWWADSAGALVVAGVLLREAWLLLRATRRR